MSNFWDEQEAIGSVDKNKREKIVVTKCKRNGKEYLDARIYTSKSESSHEYIPTTKGFNIEKEKKDKLLDLLKLV